MSVPSSVEELIQLIRKSGMVDEPTLAAYLQRRHYSRGLAADVREFADDMVSDGVLTNFQAEQFLLGKWRGFTIGKYKLLERVGVGGMGQVFLCEHMFMKRRVAVKVLPPAKAEQPAALGRFYREARAAGSLHHPNIVRTQDIDQDGNLHFIVMEYVDGSNLLDAVKKFGPMDIRRATHYALQIARGLEYAFRNGIIHRDVKPGNVLIDRKGTARILDMGLARFYKDHGDQLTLKYDDKIVLGTADYVAPEQVANSHSVDIRADIYGLGATFYFLLAGHPPFPTGTVSQKLLWHRTKEPTPIRQIRPEVPEGLAEAVARMMSKDPKARFQTPAQVAAELERWVNEAEVPLPALEEMPVLSPAATEVVNTGDAEEAPAEAATATATASAGKRGSGPVSVLTRPAAKAAPRAEAAAATPAPTANPFSSASAVNPFGAPATWAKTGGGSPPSANPFTSPKAGRLHEDFAPTPAAEVDTGLVRGDTTPPPDRATVAADDNPFRGDLLTDAPPRDRTKLVAAAVLIGAALLGGVIATFTMGGKKVDSPPAQKG